MLVTGATGFVGSVLVPTLAASGHEIFATGRRNCAPKGASRFFPADLGESEFGKMLDGVQSVVHLAARAHVMRDTAVDPGAEYTRQNIDITARLAIAARRAGARRFVFSSSVKAVGEFTGLAPYSESDHEAPVDSYGKSKLSAERELQSIAEQYGLDVVVFRPPLMYGPGVRGNLDRLMRMIDLGCPLPLGGVNNRRSLLSARNFSSAIETAIDKGQSGFHRYFVSDGPPVSTPDLVRKIALAMGKKQRMVNFPVPILRTLGILLNMRGEIDRLTGSLVIDDSAFRTDFGWTPVQSVEDGIEEMVRAFRNSPGMPACR